MEEEEHVLRLDGLLRGTFVVLVLVLLVLQLQLQLQLVLAVFIFARVVVVRGLANTSRQTGGRPSRSRSRFFSQFPPVSSLPFPSLPWVGVCIVVVGLLVGRALSYILYPSTAAPRPAFCFSPLAPLVFSFLSFFFSSFWFCFSSFWFSPSLLLILSLKLNVAPLSLLSLLFRSIFLVAFRAEQDKKGR